MRTKEFQTVPGVGEKIAQAFNDLGFTKVSDLKNKNPKKFMKSCVESAGNILIAVFYMFLGVLFILPLIINIIQNY